MQCVQYVLIEKNIMSLFLGQSLLKKSIYAKIVLNHKKKEEFF